MAWKYKYSEDDKSLDLYLREIGETPLLTREEEQKLAEKVKQGDKKSLDKMTRANLRFVVSVAKQYQNQGLALADLISVGNLGLMKACKRFDADRGFKFISYAVWWIRQAILSELAEQSRVVRLPLNRVGTLHKINKVSRSLEQTLNRDPSADEIAAEIESTTSKEVTEAMKISSKALSMDESFTESDNNTLLDVLEDDTILSPDERMISQELKLEIEKALESLTPREAEVISLYFGLNRSAPLTLEEIGAEFNLTRERIRQIKEKALRRLKHASRSRRLKDFFN